MAPVWAKDGSRIYDSVAPGDLMEAGVVPASDLKLVAPRQVQRRVIPNPVYGTSFDSAPRRPAHHVERQRRRPEPTERQSLLVARNWFEEVERLAPKR